MFKKCCCTGSTPASSGVRVESLTPRASATLMNGVRSVTEVSTPIFSLQMDYNSTAAAAPVTPRMTPRVQTDGTVNSSTWKHLSEDPKNAAKNEKKQLRIVARAALLQASSRSMEDTAAKEMVFVRKIGMTGDERTENLPVAWR